MVLMALTATAQHPQKTVQARAQPQENSGQAPEHCMPVVAEVVHMYQQIPPVLAALAVAVTVAQETVHPVQTAEQTQAVAAVAITVAAAPELSLSVMQGGRHNHGKKYGADT